VPKLFDIPTNFMMRYLSHEKLIENCAAKSKSMLKTALPL